ncbi:MAG: oligosaccharide flippase family protein [Lachnospiraceae bacterium]|nr:oligosaccharide flippase family protein [Lachnospiraceae bacterium]
MKKKISDILNLYKNMSTPAKASIWFLFCNILQMGLGVISTPIFTRIMEPSEFGITNTYNSWRNILIIFTSVNLSYGVFNNAMVKYEDAKTRNQYVSSMQCLYSLITCAYFIFYLLTRNWCNSVLNMSTSLVVMMFADLLLYPALLFWSGRQRYEYKYKSLVAVTLVMSVLYIFVGVVAVLLSKDKAMARITSTIAVNVAFGVFFYIYHFIKGKKLVVPKFWKFALAFNIPLIPHYLSEIVLTQSDRIMISKLESDAATANYTIAYSIVLIMQLVMSAISASYLPWSYEQLKAKNYESLKKMGNILIVLISGCIFMLMMFIPEIIYIFAGNKYSDAVYCIPPIALSIFFMFLYELFSTVEFFYAKNIFVMIASVMAAALNVGLNAYFIPIFGYHAAGYTTLFCYFSYALGHYIFYRRICKKTLDIKEIYDRKFIMLLSAFMFAVTITVNLVYDKILIRYGMAVILIAVAYIKRNVIIEKFRMMKGKE